MKKSIMKTAILLVLVFILSLSIVACDKTSGEDNNIPQEKSIAFYVDGDVENTIKFDLNELPKMKYTFAQDGASVTGNGWKLNDILDEVKFLYTENDLMITAYDGTSAIVDLPLTSDIYLYLGDKGDVCVEGINYPPVVGIKGVSEATVITKNEESEDGYRLVNNNETQIVSKGNAKKRLFNKGSLSSTNDNDATKYTIRKDFSVADFSRVKNNNVVYFNDYDYIYGEGVDSKPIKWLPGGLCVEANGSMKSLFGIASGTSHNIAQSFHDMKTEIDANNKVLFILVDGFSWQQATQIDELSTLKATKGVTQMSTSTNLAISPIALAAMLTGETPFVNGVFWDKDDSRQRLPLKTQDIFEYTKEKGKSVLYIEGNSNLVITEERPVYGAMENSRDTEKGIFDLAMKGIQDDKDLIFAHFHGVDNTNHKYGPMSSEAKQTLLKTEEYVATLIAAFDGTVIVTSDHGQYTTVDSEQNERGEHGDFTHLDMFVPYYTFRK